MGVGIEYLNVYGGRAFIEVEELFRARGLDPERQANLMMRRKAVNLPWEDPITNAVNAAKPILDRLSAAERESVSLLITASESGVDFGKSIANYVHAQLGLSRHCRVFEIKQACYGGTAALRTAVGQIVADARPGAKALVIATDVARPSVKLTYAEPSQGVAAVAMLVGEDPVVLDLDLGAHGLCSFEVMDTCRPTPEIETGDPDLSLLSYLECLKTAFDDYSARVEGVDLRESFAAFAFHAPFPGMVKGAHRSLMRSKLQAKSDEIEADFKVRLAPSLEHCAQVGNAYSATVFVALAGLLDHTPITDPARIGLFSYGSGCSSEFYSGVVDAGSVARVRGFGIGAALASRRRLSIPEYDAILSLNARAGFGTETATIEIGDLAELHREQFKDRGLLTLTGFEGYRRLYAWS